MYVVVQHPRFFKAYWVLLKAAVENLFRYMHETHDGVQDMACDTFIKIAKTFGKLFVQLQVGEVTPYIDEILKNISTIICDLEPPQVYTFYEAVGYIIGSHTDLYAQRDATEKYMELLNRKWDAIIEETAKSVDALKDPDIVNELGNILKTNIRACKALGYTYVYQLDKIYLDMLNVYTVMSKSISDAIVQNGHNVTEQPLIKAMTIKKEILKLISLWVSCSTNLNEVLENFIPPLLKAVLVDYKDCQAREAREPEVLSIMATIVNRLGEHMTREIPTIFDNVFECTLEMISKNFEEFPEHRTNFYLLLRAVIKHCFSALEVRSDWFMLVINSIIWAFKHTIRNVADTGLQILYQLLKNISNKDDTQSFYQTYYTIILQHLFSVVTDTCHTEELSMQAKVLALMFRIVKNGKITAPLNLVEQADGTPNVVYIQQFIAHLLKTAFSHLSDAQIRITISGFFDLDQDIPKFKEHLRDLLVWIHKIEYEDDSDLFPEELEAALHHAEEEKQRIQSSVPGMIPHDRDEDTQG